MHPLTFWSALYVFALVFTGAAALFNLAFVMIYAGYYSVMTEKEKQQFWNSFTFGLVCLYWFLHSLF